MTRAGQVFIVVSITIFKDSEGKQLHLGLNVHRQRLDTIQKGGTARLMDKPESTQVRIGMWKWQLIS